MPAVLLINITTLVSKARHQCSRLSTTCYVERLTFRCPSELATLRPRPDRSRAGPEMNGFALEGPSHT